MASARKKRGRPPKKALERPLTEWEPQDPEHIPYSKKPRSKAQPADPCLASCWDMGFLSVLVDPWKDFGPSDYWDNSRMITWYKGWQGHPLRKLAAYQIFAPELPPHSALEKHAPRIPNDEETFHPGPIQCPTCKEYGWHLYARNHWGIPADSEHPMGHVHILPA